jgi:hypothetical protein
MSGETSDALIYSLKVFSEGFLKIILGEDTYVLSPWMKLLLIYLAD